jgi:hypothetical protein
MSAKTAVIEDVIDVREWTGDRGTVYYHDILMDNGDRGSIGKKTKGALKVGDSLTYVLEENDRGNKIKEFKENGFSGSFNGRNNGNGGGARGGNESFALSYAKDTVVAMMTGGLIQGSVSSGDVAKVVCTMAETYLDWLNNHKS